MTFLSSPGNCSCRRRPFLHRLTAILKLSDDDSMKIQTVLISQNEHSVLPLEKKASRRSPVLGRECRGRVEVIRGWRSSLLGGVSNTLLSTAQQGELLHHILHLAPVGLLSGGQTEHHNKMSQVSWAAPWRTDGHNITIT